MIENERSQKSDQLIAYRTDSSMLESRASAFGELAQPLHGRMSHSTAAPLTNYFHVLLKRRWTIIAVTVLLTGIAAAYSFSVKPVYEATARVEVEPETPMLQAQSSSDSYEKVDADDTFLQTQIQVLKSDNLAWQTIEQLNLASHLSKASANQPADSSSDNRKVQILGAFNTRLKVDQVPKARMIAVSFQDSDPRLAAQVATALVNNYLEYNFQEKDQAIRRSGWMEKQLESLKTNVEQSQQALVRYEQDNQIVNSSDKQNILEQMLADQSRDLDTAESERIQKESLYRQVTTNKAQLASLVHDDLLEKLEEKSAELKQQYTQTAAQYGPNFPNAKRLQLEINENQDEVQHEQERIINRISNDFNAASNREKLAQAAVEQQKVDVGKLNQLLVRDNTLRHEFETNQQLYDSLLQRL
jgi:polysaccharide biosynthesis transport protein